MRNLRIGTRLLLGFTLIVALTVALGCYALYEQAQARQFTNHMDTRDFRVVQAIQQLSGSESDMRATRELAMMNAALEKLRLPAENPAAQEAAWHASRDENLKLLNDLEASTVQFERDSLTADRAGEWRAIRAAAVSARQSLLALTPDVNTIFARLNAGDLAGAVAILPKVEKMRQDYEAKLAACQQQAQQQVELGRSSIESYYVKTQTSVIVGLIIAALAGTLLAIFIQRSITQPLAGFIDFAQRVGKGDLTAEAVVRQRDELGNLAMSLNYMVAGLRDVASQTRGVAENLNAATAEILASTQQQAASTAEQAAAVQQANATMAEISQSGAQISERAKQVAGGAEATSSASRSGLQAVQNTTSTMEGIREQAEAVAENVIALSEKTQAVGEIISTVNDIAEQSHLLALNAAIEAAAAGEHGRGFAVVASEMKNLAEQSKQATVQVRSILGDIQKAINSSVMLTEEAVKRVESGRLQADIADRTIRELTGNIQESVQAFQQIVAGSAQQQIGFEQVSQAFRSIGTAAQQAAASTKQSEKAAANLNALAQQLRGAVERYRI